MICRTVISLLITGAILISTDISAASNGDRIVVMPVEVAETAAAGERMITEVIRDYFAANRSVKLISEEEKQALIAADTGNRLQIIRKVTAELKSNSALLFTLTRYRERLGDRLSVKDPASLAFEFKLVSAEDGRVTCSGLFNETQQPLSENILDLPKAARRGFKWLTVRELAVEAVREKFDACPALATPVSR